MTQTLKKENLEDKFEEYSQVVYKNQRLLLEIDKFAKSLGFKIFRLDCEFETDCGTQILSTTALNQPSEEYLDYIDKHFNR